VGESNIVAGGMPVVLLRSQHDTRLISKCPLPFTNLQDTARGIRHWSDQPPSEEDDSEVGGTIQFSGSSRQVAWDRFWDQIHALMPPIVAFKPDAFKE